MSSLSNANTLSSAFIDLGTYGELESYMYGNPNKLSIEKFQTKSINLLKSKVNILYGKYIGVQAMIIN